MTTVVYRDGVIAADTQVSDNGGHIFARIPKIVRGSDGVLGGAGGEAAYVQAFREWVLAGREEAPPSDMGDCNEAFLVYPNGSIRHYNNAGHFDFTADFVAIGSGAYYAYGALAMGATAEEALKVAASFDPYTSAPFHTFRRDEDG